MMFRFFPFFLLAGCVSGRLLQVEVSWPDSTWVTEAPCPYKEVAFLRYEAWSTAPMHILENDMLESYEISYAGRTTALSNHVSTIELTESNGDVVEVRVDSRLAPARLDSRFEEWMESGRADAVIHYELEIEPVFVGKSECEKNERCEWVKGEDWIAKVMYRNIASGLAVKWIPELCNGWTGKASSDSGPDKEPDIEQGSTAPVEEVSD